jgi:hypothetical protein
MGTRRAREQWVALVSDFERSQQTPERFCASRGIRATRLAWWRWRLRAPALVETTGEVQMVPVDVVRVAPASGPDITIVVSGVEVRVAVGADAGYVATLVAHLRAQC